MTAVLHTGQTLIDVALQQLNVADELIALALLNGNSITDDVVGGTVLSLPDITDQVLTKPVFTLPVKKAIAVLHERQTLVDAAIQNCGSAGDFINVALLNGYGITDDVDYGTNLIMPAVSNSKVVKELMPYGNVPISAVGANDFQQEGIGFWIIENNFIVQ